MSTFSHMHPDSRLWIYQSDREFNAAELDELRSLLTNFTQNWAAHGKMLDAAFEIKYNRFILLAVNKEGEQASGCSIDTSVQLIREIAQRFQVDCFDRFQVCYFDGEDLKSANKAEFQQLVEEGEVSGSTKVFNNLITRVGDLDSGWLVPMSESWHGRVFSAAQPAFPAL